MDTCFESIQIRRIFDSIHSFIDLTQAERILVNLPSFFRLRFIKQCGVAFLVYPGATDTHFEHSLGVMQIASKLF